MINNRKICTLVLLVIGIPGHSEPHLDDRNGLAMYTAIRETCAEVIPERKDYFLNSRFMFESVYFHRLVGFRKEPEYLNLLETYRKETRRPGHELDIKNCIGLASETGMLQLISKDTSKPMPPINLTSP